MGRAKRADAAGHCYHMLNRANLRAEVFHKPEDYAAMEGIITEALAIFNVRVYCYCLMPNHWHFVVSPQVDGEMGRFAQWVTLTHTQRYHAHYQIVGEGHLYQGRFKSFPVQCDDHFLTLCRYVERNPYRARLCDSPEVWRWSSLYRWRHPSAEDGTLLSPWPVSRRDDWKEWVRTDFSASEQRQIDWSMKRGVPFGDETWVESIARKYGLESTMRPRGRPRKFPKAAIGSVRR